MDKFSASLNAILEDVPPETHHVDNAYELVRELAIANQRILDIKHELSKVRQNLSASLALALRKAKPGLSVAVDKNGCRIGYKTKTMMFNPNFENQIWEVNSTNERFRREFLTKYRRLTLLSSDISPLVDAIIEYFTAYYRTLGEDISGTGKILIEDRSATLIEIAQWRGLPTFMPKKLFSRRVMRGELV